MKKINKGRFLSLLYAICLQFIIMPIFGSVTSLLYDRLTLIKFIQGNMVLTGLVIITILVINLFLMYEVAKLFNKLYKMDLIYYIITGLVTIFISVWIEVYYYAIAKTSCNAIANIDCLGATKDFNLFTLVLIFASSYYFIYIVMHKMVGKIVLDKKSKGNK